MVTAAPGAPAGVELLERSLSWTQGVLREVRDDLAGAATPCTGWTLLDLLRHMVDSLAAAAEAATGRVDRGTATVDPAAGPVALAGQLRSLGCSALGSWVHADVGPVALGRPVGAPVSGAVTVAAAVLTEVGALEVAVHGWDVARTCGGPADLPPLLAAALLPVAARRVGPDDRPGRFAPAATELSGTDPASLLLAHLGRRA